MTTADRRLSLALALGAAWGIGGAEVARRAAHAAGSAVDTIPEPPAPEEARAVLAFWQAAGPALWFAKDAAFDRAFRERFLPLHEAAARGALDGWQATPEGTLALLILLDQFPRNAFRGTPRMYATDAAARALAERAIAAGHAGAVPAELRLFLILPFAHSEDPADQDRSVALAGSLLGPEQVARAEHHRSIVRRFGRFPHRNAILGRETTPEEWHWLDQGGYRG